MVANKRGSGPASGKSVAAARQQDGEEDKWGNKGGRKAAREKQVQDHVKAKIDLFSSGSGGSATLACIQKIADSLDNDSRNDEQKMMLEGEKMMLEGENTILRNHF